jgi:putative tricarboxylic transport membrane protein
VTRWMDRAALGAIALVALAGTALAAPQELTIMAPAAPGGGWDQTARSMQESLQAAAIVPSVQVVNVPGAGGTIGLAQFVSNDKGNPTKLIVGGYVMVGAIIANKSPVSLADVTPLARLTGEYDAIVVPAASPIKSLGDLVEKLKADPGSVSWAGGSAGGVDHIAVGLIAKAAGVDPTKINYIPYSGGGEALAAILGGQVTAGISGYGEFAGQIDSGELRLLALTGGEATEGKPTLKSQGVDVDVQNWRMVAAAPGITDAEKADLLATVDGLVNSAQWKEVLASKGWQNTYLAGADFDKYLADQVTATEAVLKDVGIAQ